MDVLETKLHASEKQQAEAVNLWSEEQVSRSALNSESLLESRELQKSLLQNHWKYCAAFTTPFLEVAYNVRDTGPMTWPQEFILLGTEWVPIVQFDDVDVKRKGRRAEKQNPHRQGQMRAALLHCWNQFLSQRAQ